MATIIPSIVYIQNKHILNLYECGYNMKNELKILKRKNFTEF